MRLINADKLKEAINSSLNTGRETFSPEIMCEAVDEQPTAFDVDKVVEQLKDLKAMYWVSIANTGDEKLDVAYEKVGNALDKAIELVKEGIVE